MSAAFATVVRRVRARVHRGARARDLDDEMAFHLEMLERDRRAAGMSESDARDASRRQLGNRTRIAETSWDALSLGPFDTIAREMRFASRAIRKSPGFALTVILTLTLGIGATATVFSVVDHVLLRPLDYPNADRLVELYERGSKGDRRLVAYPTLQDWARAGASVDGMAYIRGNRVNLTTPEGQDRIVVAFVSPEFFRTIGTRAELGRTFVTEEEVPGGANSVVLSHDEWLNYFGGDPHILGRAVTLDSGSAIVIGVMPANFGVPSWAQAWQPVGQIIDRDPVLKRRDFHADSRAIARMAPGVNVARVTRELSAAQRRVAEAYPDAEAGWTGVELVPFRTAVVGDFSTALWALGAGVLLILLIACVNLANVAAVRGASRGREVAVRLALGASRLQVARQLLAEMLLLAVVGGCAGVASTYWVVGWLRARAPFDLPRATEIVVDARVFGLALALTLGTAVLFGVLPALRAAAPRGAANELLGGRNSYGGSRRETRFGALLVGLQFALALVLLIGAGLLVQSYRRLQDVQLGFDPRDLYSLTISSPIPADSDGKATLALYDRLVERLRAIPGIDDAAVVNFMPLGGAGIPTQLRVPGRAPSSDDNATYITATEGYLRALRIQLVRGRWYSLDEMRAPSDGVVISESLAKKYWPSSDAIGKPITIFRSSQDRANFGQAVPSVVIGVVRDVRQFGPQSDPDAAVYVPMAAETWPWASLVVRSHASSPEFIDGLRKAVIEVEPRFAADFRRPSEGFDPVSRTLSSELAPRRYLLGLVGAFSACALILAAVGIFGVTSYAVARRTRELGIRLALGAAPRAILRTVLLRGMLPIAAGCVTGLVGTYFAVRIVSHLLYDTSPSDPAVLVIIPLLLAAVGLAACYLPARRAARVNPTIALHTD